MNFISGGIHAAGTLKNELLKLEGELSPEKKKIYGQLDRIMDNSLEGVQRVTDIVNSLKFFANPGKADRQYHDLEELLYSTMLNLEKTIPENIQLRKNIPPGTIIYCYDEQLQQVFIHILLNAIQVLEKSDQTKNKIIEITAEQTNRDNRKFSCISISNSGPPIPEQDLKKIYDPFYTINDSGSGKGLGMAISYMIIKEHKGWIEARNEKGLVIFDIMLPKS
ncbi:MAG: HAMP domain-containing sensor histidine kinase [bacterium]